MVGDDVVVGEVLVGDDVVVGELRVVSVGEDVVGELRLVPPLPPPPVGEEVPPPPPVPPPEVPPPPPPLAYAIPSKKTRALTIKISETTEAKRRQRQTTFWRCFRAVVLVPILIGNQYPLPFLASTLLLQQYPNSAVLAVCCASL